MRGVDRSDNRAGRFDTLRTKIVAAAMCVTVPNNTTTAGAWLGCVIRPAWTTHRFSFCVFIIENKHVSFIEQSETVQSGETCWLA